MKAARLYFDTVGAVNKQPRTCGVINEQNNYIQINNTILSQENLGQLTAEQLNQIENIITSQVVRVQNFEPLLPEKAAPGGAE
jgi:hypothetical protein